jgi:sugar fermentation stimulation protein A
MSDIEWPQLIKGVLVKRYKRFLADVILEDGETVTAHCPNSGRMTGCSQPGRPVFLSHHDNPKRKLKYTWELIDMPTSLVGVNTLMPNRLVAHCLRNGDLPGLDGYSEVKTEVRIGARTRLDIMLSRPTGRPCYVEIKNCTLVEAGTAMFPDAPTARGRKHLEELARLRSTGARAIIFYLIQRCDARAFAPAAFIDPEYAGLLRDVVTAGVEVMAFDVKMDLSRIALGRSIPCRLA